MCNTCNDPSAVQNPQARIALCSMEAYARELEDQIAETHTRGDKAELEVRLNKVNGIINDIISLF